MVQDEDQRRALRRAERAQGIELRVGQVARVIATVSAIEDGDLHALRPEGVIVARAWRLSARQLALQEVGVVVVAVDVADRKAQGRQERAGERVFFRCAVLDDIAGVQHEIDLEGQRVDGAHNRLKVRGGAMPVIGEVGRADVRVAEVDEAQHALNLLQGAAARIGGRSVGRRRA